MKLTKAQIDAITSRSKDLIVSAGAGSGKTTVLTRRIIERIKQGDSVTDFLVVTFMNSAAADIKQKLYDSLSAELALAPDNKHIYRQMLLVPEANICTISSYCLSLVRENFGMLGISPKSRVIDETEKSMLLTRVCDGLVTDLYDDGGEDFLLLADTFSGDKGDEPLLEKMISLYEKMRVMISPEKLLSDCAVSLRRDAETTRENGFFASETGKAIRSRLIARADSIVSAANELYSFAAENATEGKYLEPLDELCARCDGIRASAGASYKEFIDTCLQPVKPHNLLSKGCPEKAREYIKDEKSRINKAINDLISDYCRGNDGFIAQSFEKCAKITDSVNSFLKELDNRFSSLKKESALLDYADFERYALALLQTYKGDGNPIPSELCLIKRKNFKEVLIDEYQDVNPMQDRLFTLLSGYGSRFMVGDVKQSIYRFRNAYPDIFLGYKDSYPDYSEGAENARILLRENFRCSQTIIDYVNYLFDTVTAGSSYRNEYEGEWLLHASESPEIAHPVIVAVAEKQKLMAKEARRDETEFIAREIKRLVSEEYSNDGNRIEYGDIAVMLSAMKGFSIEYEKAFKKYGVPYKSESSEDFLANPVVSLALSAMRAVDDPVDDISLCALMRSPICNFTSDELYRIRLKLKDTPFWNALTAAAMPKRKRTKRGRYGFSKNFGECGLCVKCRAFIKRLSNWRHDAEGVQCGEFLNGFFVSTGLLRIADAENKRKSLLLLYDYARRYESTDYHGLSGFIDYIGELRSGGRSITDVPSAGDEDAVSFITVHKSKGLEYKVCFLAGADKRFRLGDTRGGLTLLRTDGIYFKLRDRVGLTVYDPLCNVLAKEKEKEAALGEELRKLYVALTRAKERLYITGVMPEDWRDKSYLPSTAQSFMELVLYNASLGEKLFFDVRTVAASEGEAGYIPAPIKRNVVPTDDMLRAVTYEYPFASAVTTAGKISVSELREGLLEDDEYNRSMLSVPASRVGYKPSFAGDESAEYADIGTANHVFMQFCDFDKIDSSGVVSEADRLADIAMITKQQRGMLDINALEVFFKSELYKQMRSSVRLYREKRFSVRDNAVIKGETVLVQGVIDCFFENPDGTYTVVDYKTDRVRTGKELADRHRVQLECYCRAVKSMTGHDVTRALLYSFALGSEVDLPL